MVYKKHLGEGNESSRRQLISQFKELTNAVKNANEVVEFHWTLFLVFIKIKPHFIISVHVHNLNGGF